MPKFVYRAKRGLGETLDGDIEADNKEDAITKLVAQELFPITVEELKSADSTKPPPSVKKRNLKYIIGLRRGVSSKEILNFTQKLHTLIRAKVELFNCLKILHEQTEDSRLREIILHIYNLTKEGRPFSESLKEFPDVFSPLYVSIITAGEASGHMDTALEQIAEFLYREENLKNKIFIALAYPSLLVAVGLVSIFVLINFVVPRLGPIFQGLGKDLPLITKFILKLSTVSNKVWFWAFGVMIITAVFLYVKKSSPFLNRILKSLKTHIPIVKRLSEDQELAHFSRSLGLLLTSGVMALKALEIASMAVETPRLKKELKAMYDKVAAGENMSKSMKEATGLPGFFVKMVAVGEESGRLNEVLGDITMSYTQQIESDIALISSLLEPLLILGIGLILGAVVLSILLPTFQVTQLVR